MRFLGTMKRNGDGGRWGLFLTYWQGKLCEHSWFGSTPVRYERFYLFPFVFVYRHSG